MKVFGKKKTITVYKTVNDYIDREDCALDSLRYVKPNEINTFDTKLTESAKALLLARKYRKYSLFLTRILSQSQKTLSIHQVDAIRRTVEKIKKSLKG